MRYIYFTVLFVFISACDMFNHEQKIVDRFYLVALEGKETMDVSIPVNENGLYATIIGSCVYAVGHNSNYIIVKQHPYELDNELNKEITNYFIIPIKNKGNSAKQIGVIGPLVADSFKSKTIELGIENLKFDIVFDDLE